MHTGRVLVPPTLKPPPFSSRRLVSFLRRYDHDPTYVQPKATHQNHHLHPVVEKKDPRYLQFPSVFWSHRPSRTCVRSSTEHLCLSRRFQTTHESQLRDTIGLSFSLSMALYAGISARHVLHATFTDGKSWLRSVSVPQRAGCPPVLFRVCRRALLFHLCSARFNLVNRSTLATLAHVYVRVLFFAPRRNTQFRTPPKSPPNVRSSHALGTTFAAQLFSSRRMAFWCT